MPYFYHDVRVAERDMAKVEQALRDSLAAEGFGIVSEIDVAATFAAKLGIEFRPYKILGACNPALAFRAIGLEDKIGTLLPCNIIIQQLGLGGIEVAAINPAVTMAQLDKPGLRELAREASERLERAVHRLVTTAKEADHAIHQS